MSLRYAERRYFKEVLGWLAGKHVVDRQALRNIIVYLILNELKQ